MKRIFSVSILGLLWATSAWAHGDITTLPDSVQIMQYRLLLYMNPDDPKPRNALAMALFRTNELAEAQKELQYILDKSPADFDALDGMGIILIKMGRYEDALKYLRKAQEINDKDMMVHVHLSVLFEKMELPEQGRSELDKAGSLASNPAQREGIEKELRLMDGQENPPQSSFEKGGSKRRHLTD